MRLPANLPDSPDTPIVPLPLVEYPDLRWAIPLWAERGRIGVLLLGEKADGGLYTQEEIEIARASGERIVDMLAAEQMATRLMQLQRQRLFRKYFFQNQKTIVSTPEKFSKVHLLKFLPRQQKSCFGNQAK